MGDAALHLDLFEQPGEKRVFQQPAGSTRRPHRAAFQFSAGISHAKTTKLAKTGRGV